MLPPLSLPLSDEAATLALGARIALSVGPGMSIHLSGELGSGKTTLARGLLRALGHAGKVKSPTYSLVELYPLSRLDLYHFDFYRFHDPKAWLDSGFREHFNERSLCLVEWPEKVGDLLPAPDLRITLVVAPHGRDATIEAFTESGRRCLRSIAEQASRSARNAAD
ncbi:MAG: tRNA (adenosine(37)-N6)-threonylcarbamoyltransferase complex ATPase subunit type 1 TsaE [Burkholderiales bacterium]|nr:tRNA (adenosine(37)-N6)-threonylcarbamoyltransferase complex ATPase subunit type 1 TsaE [Burkholderiales bacterium]